MCGALAHFDLAALYQVEIRRRHMLVERAVRDNLEAINDLSVDVQKDIETIDEAIGALSVVRKQYRPIGFKKAEEKK